MNRILMLFSALCVTLTSLTPTRAQEPPLVHLTTSLLLGRACAKEESLWPRGIPTEAVVAHHMEAFRDGCWGINQVYERGAARSHWTYERMVREYSVHVFEPDEDRPWVADLRVGAWEPAGWPAQLPWNERPDRPDHPTGYGLWMEEFSLANDIRTHVIVMPYGHKCPVPPDHWGGEMDHWRGDANGWVQERCGDARNEFWLVPSFHTEEELARARASLVAPPIAADVAQGTHGRL